MSSIKYTLSQNNADKTLDLTRLRPYGDTMNDGKVQISFTLPVKDNEQGLAAAGQLAKKMGFSDPAIAYHASLDKEFTFYVIYGAISHSVDYANLKVHSLSEEIMDMDQVNQYIKDRIGRKIVVVGASTGTDAHTVGIDAIFNRKGFAGHYGLERYDMIEAYNLGSQVQNDEMIAKARELKADAILVSQTVTQKDVHIHNLTELIELVEAEGWRQNYIMVCGGSRITNELAKELGYDAGFGAGKFAEDVATFIVTEMAKRGQPPLPTAAPL